MVSKARTSNKPFRFDTNSKPLFSPEIRKARDNNELLTEKQVGITKLRIGPNSNKKEYSVNANIFIHILQYLPSETLLEEISELNSFFYKLIYFYAPTWKHRYLHILNNEMVMDEDLYGHHFRRLMQRGLFVNFETSWCTDDEVYDIIKKETDLPFRTIRGLDLAQLSGDDSILPFFEKLLVQCPVLEEITLEFEDQLKKQVHSIQNTTRNNLKSLSLKKLIFKVNIKWNGMFDYINSFLEYCHELEMIKVTNQERRRCLNKNLLENLTRHCPKLKHVILNDSRITCDYPCVACPKFTAKELKPFLNAPHLIRQLQILDLSSCNMDDECFALFGKFLEITTQLKRLQLDSNHFFDKGLRAFSAGLKKNTSLLRLKLLMERFKENTSLHPLAEAIITHPKLQYCKLSHNNFSMGTLDALLKIVEQNKLLHTLKFQCEMENIQLNSTLMKRIAKSIEIGGNSIVKFKMELLDPKRIPVKKEEYSTFVKVLQENQVLKRYRAYLYELAWYELHGKFIFMLYRYNKDQLRRLIRCETCHNIEKPLHRCSACRAVAYCSKECQIRDWKRPNGHKENCKNLQFVYRKTFKDELV